MRVYEYETLDRPDRHCREGMAVADTHGLRDTYWGSFGSDSHMLTKAERATAKFLFNTDEYDEVRVYHRGVPEAWLERAPEDRARLTSQHGLQVTYYIRKGSEPDLTTKIENARAELEKAESELRSATRGVEWAQQKLDALLVPALSVGKDET